MEAINTAGPNRLAPDQTYAVGSAPIAFGPIAGLIGNAPALFDWQTCSIPAHLPANIAQRIARKTDKRDGPDAVWPWLGSVSQSNGYPQISYKDQLTGERTTRAIHRVVMEIVLGRRLERGECVLHAVGVPRRDLNPRHLRLGTQRENILQARAEGRLRGGGHRITGETAKQIADEHHVHGIPILVLAHRLGYSVNTIRSVVTGRSHARSTGRVYSPGKPGRPPKRVLMADAGSAPQLAAGPSKRRAAHSMGAVV